MRPLFLEEGVANFLKQGASAPEARAGVPGGRMAFGCGVLGRRVTPHGVETPGAPVGERGRGFGWWGEAEDDQETVQKLLDSGLYGLCAGLGKASDADDEAKGCCWMRRPGWPRRRRERCARQWATLQGSRCWSRLLAASRRGVGVKKKEKMARTCCRGAWRICQMCPKRSEELVWHQNNPIGPLYRHL